jgi:membrane protein YqaA with SNARE-associated domain
MASVDEFLAGLFSSLGPAGAIIALYLIFLLDATLFPALPPLFIVLFYTAYAGVIGPVPWAVTLVAIAVAGEVSGNFLLWLVVRRLLVRPNRMPKRIERLMAGWVNFLVVSDERVILLNRIAPVVPLVGAFIAVMRWDLRRSLAYVALGAAAYYAVVVALVAVLGVVLSRTEATIAAILFVLAIIGISFAASHVRRRRILTRPSTAGTDGPPARGPAGPSRPPGPP